MGGQCGIVELQYSVLKFKNLKLKIVRNVLLDYKEQLGPHTISFLKKHILVGDIRP